MLNALNVMIWIVCYKLMACFFKTVYVNPGKYRLKHFQFEGI